MAILEAIRAREETACADVAALLRRPQSENPGSDQAGQAAGPSGAQTGAGMDRAAPSRPGQAQEPQPEGAGDENDTSD
eukprot:7142567-Pyramimonas_sp.AAC.1